MVSSYAGMTLRVLAIELPLPPHMWVGSAVGIVPLELPLDRALPVNICRLRRLRRLRFCRELLPV